MSRVIQKGATDRSVIMRAIDSTDGTPETGFAYNTSGIDLWYRREGGAVVSITEATLAAVDSAHSDGGVIHLGNGYFRLDPPDAAFATGANSVFFGGTATGMIIVGTEIQLVNYNPEDAVRMGMTALPNANADAAGGLPISDAGALDLDTQLATLTNGTYGLSAIETLVDDLESRLTATRAGYLDNLSAGAVALASGVTVTTNNDKTGYTVSTVSDKTGYALSPSGIVDVWSYSNRTLTSVDNAFPRGEAVNNLTFLMKSSTNHVSGATGLTVSGVVRKDSGSFAEVTGSISEIAYGLYDIDTISTTEMDAKVVTLRFFATGADDTFIELITI